MNFLVVRPRDQAISILQVIRDADTQITGDFESWAVKDGTQVMFVNKHMGRLLESFRVGGNYMGDKALYALEYPELCAVIEKHMGPSDKQRVANLTDRMVKRRKPWYRSGWFVWSVLLGGVVVGTIGLTVQFLIAIVVFPIILHLINQKLS